MLGILRSDSAIWLSLTPGESTSNGLRPRDIQEPLSRPRPAKTRASLDFSDRTIFVLTPKAERFLRQTMIVPYFDATNNELRFGDAVVNRFRGPVPVLERILAGFQVQGWREWIVNPLPIGNDGSRQLRDVVKSLNTNQHPQLIRFHCNGHHVLWEALEAKQDDRDLLPDCLQTYA